VVFACPVWFFDDPRFDDVRLKSTSIQNGIKLVGVALRAGCDSSASTLPYNSRLPTLTATRRTLPDEAPGPRRLRKKY
jgi:hypothetical protein